MRFRAHAAAAMLVLATGIVLSSGTMVPYAAMAPRAEIVEPCHYLASDHHHYLSIHRMLAGDPRQAWDWSYVLRRILFPLLAFPFVKAWGFETGGFVASLLIHLAAMYAFGVFLRRRLGDRAAIAALWLLATYPGITYWAALPYAYVVIVPGSLISLVLLYRFAETDHLHICLAASFALGLIFTGYDLFPFFAPAALVVLLHRRRPLWAAVSACMMALPTAVVLLLFRYYGIRIANPNSSVFGTLLRSYLQGGEPELWIAYIRSLPGVVLSNFAFSNFLFLPLLASVAFVVVRDNRRLFLPETLVAIGTLLLCIFNNAAPPYPGWQLRGEWVARLYQPGFVALLMYAARAAGRLDSGLARRLWTSAVVATVLANATVVLSPVTLNSAAATLYQKFYAHADKRALLDNMKRFGRRPLGFCRQEHLEEGWNPPTERRGSLPKWMYR